MWEAGLWLLFGALSGWVLSLIIRTEDRSSSLYSFIGAVGAVMGGVLFKLYGQNVETIEANSIFSAIIGSLSLIAIVGFIRKDSL